MVQLTSEEQADMDVALDALLASPESQAKIDKAELVQIRIKVRKGGNETATPPTVKRLGGGKDFAQVGACSCTFIFR